MNPISTSFFPTFCFFILAGLLFSGCTGDELIRRGDSIEEAYQKSLAMYESENYDDAARAFERVLQIGRGTDLGRDAQYYLADSYFMGGQYLVAAAEFERFISQFPRDPRRQEVQFKEAYCYYELSPRYRLDQTYTRQAIEKFRIFNSGYPNSERTEEAAEYISELRAKLARKLYAAAELYMRVDAYEAATVYYGLVFNTYPETTWAEQALVNQISAYNIYAENSVRERQPERFRKAVESYETYLQLFPDGPNRSEAERLVDRARRALSELEQSGGDISAGEVD